jgi:hypothetical protein
MFFLLSTLISYSSIKFCIMKYCTLFLLAGLVLSALSAIPAAAQQSSPPWFIVFEETVSPANRVRFMEVQHEAVDLWKKHNLDVPVMAYENDDNALYWVVPIRNFASIDTLFQKMGQLSEKMKAEGYDGDAKFRDLSTISSTVMMWVPELSYHPNDESGNSIEKPYTEWMFAYLLSGHEKEAADAIKKFKAYYIEHEIDYPWETFRVLLGHNTPLLIGMFRGTTPADLDTQNGLIWKEHGAELGKLWGDVTKHAWKIENKSGWYNASLSNRPDMLVNAPTQ